LGSPCQNDPCDIYVLRAAGDAARADRVRLVMGHCPWQRVQAPVANWMRARLPGEDVPDGACGIQLFARDTHLGLPHFDHRHRFLPVLFERAGARVVCVAVRARPSAAASSKYSMLERLLAGILDLGGVMWLGIRLLSVDDVVELAPSWRGVERDGLPEPADVPAVAGTDLPCSAALVSRAQGAQSVLPAARAPAPRD
jgi:dolichol-phosphate mannosyltransferase